MDVAIKRKSRARTTFVRHAPPVPSSVAITSAHAHTGAAMVHASIVIATTLVHYRRTIITMISPSSMILPVVHVVAGVAVATVPVVVVHLLLQVCE